MYPPEKTKYLPLACDPQEHCRFPQEKEIYDIGFIGNPNYPERRTLLEQLKTEFNVLVTNTKPGIPYSKTLNQCKLTFNRSLDRDVNMRFFEAMSCGKLLLSDYLPAQYEIAKDGQQYIAYKDWADLKSKVKYYLTHEKEREFIALRGAVWMKLHHTYEHRLRTILEDFGWTKF
jgi:spore maturation protein CgeB